MQVEIDLKGTTATGRVFDERTVSFEIGEGIDSLVPRGVEIGLEKMKKNEIAQITIQPSYAFGRGGNVDKGIKSNETLTYEVSVLCSIRIRLFHLIF